MVLPHSLGWLRNDRKTKGTRVNKAPTDAAPSPAHPENPEDPHTPLDAKGNPLPANWLARVAVIWCGQAVSVFATCAASFAAIWFVTETTSSPVWLSLASAASLLPVALLSPLGGVAADRLNRKKVMIIADGTAGLFSLVLAICAVIGIVNVPLMLALLAVRASAQAFHGPALTAAMPRLVPADQLVRINTLDQALTSLSAIAGPALGILLYNVVGFHGVMLLDAACAAVACACLTIARIPTPERSDASRQSVLADLREGASFVLHDRGLRSLMLFVMATMLLLMPASSLAPLMTYQHFGGDGYQASLVEAVFGVGMLAGSAVAFAWGGKRRLAPVIIASGAATGLALAGCGLLQHDQFPLFAVLMGVAAAALGCYNAPILPIMQRRTPEEKTGRVMGIFLTGSSLAAPVGLSFSGFAAEAVGIANWFLICGVLIVVACVAAAASKGIRLLDETGETSDEKGDAS